MSTLFDNIMGNIMGNSHDRGHWYGKGQDDKYQDDHSHDGKGHGDKDKGDHSHDGKGYSDKDKGDHGRNGKGQDDKDMGDHGHDGKGQGSDKHKHVDARPGESCRGEEGAEDFVFHDKGHWRIDNYNGQEGDKLDFTEYGLTREEIASHITSIKIEADTFIVNFGDDVSITLVGQPPTWDNVITSGEGVMIYQ
ncbi:hypothetical protein [Nitrosomonas sp. Nm34]|uniref:hypothetical protein n=1 Tax=Nitrosomonas sp. Nm34 TaxID=1881055 RepID=UPI0008E5EA39|nr:hypothetical protein [Nitrosomonas sp. Nm34]SFI90262.1 hypothetical protein SAMN05428978_105513 [Nitrosomonas sp. Nm34]